MLSVTFIHTIKNIGVSAVLATQQSNRKAHWYYPVGFSVFLKHW